jgi:hypothetical protein
MTDPQPGITCPPDPGRLISDARRQQGFRDQAHLDRWFAYSDHTKECPDCGLPGDGYDGPDGWQPTVTQCADAARLLALV